MGLLANSDDDKKPLFRVWYNQKLKTKVKVDSIFDVVCQIRLSASEEWIILEGVNSVGLINANSKGGKVIIKLLDNLNGEMKALTLVFAKNKLGFDVIVSSTLTCIWEENDSQNGVINNFFANATGNTSVKTSLDTLKLEDMTINLTP